VRTLPFFLDTFPRSRRPEYPICRGDARVAVAIVGGGLTGCACAAVFATAGVKVALLEAERIGMAAAAGNGGMLRQDYDASFQQTVARYGIRTARFAWQGIRRASLDFAAALRRYDIRCDLAALPHVLFTRDGEEAMRALRREYQIRRGAGLDVSWLTSRALFASTGVQGDGGLRTGADAIDPYRACLGLAANASQRGAGIFERSAVRRIRVGRRAVEVKTERGTVSADSVIVATGSLIDDLRALRRHFEARQHYTVVTAPLPGSIKRALGAGGPAALHDTADPPHQLRWLKDDRLMFSGAERAPLAARARSSAIFPRANQLMYELSTIYPVISGVQPEWAWDHLDVVSVDRLPVIGPHRNFPRHLFALGRATHGAGVAWLAARALLRAYRGEPAKGDEALGFVRVL
jgi:gamma-glutamylputrescine oxidase